MPEPSDSSNGCRFQQLRLPAPLLDQGWTQRRTAAGIRRRIALPRLERIRRCRRIDGSPPGVASPGRDLVAHERTAVRPFSWEAPPAAQLACDAGFVGGRATGTVWPAAPSPTASPTSVAPRPRRRQAGGVPRRHLHPSRALAGPAKMRCRSPLTGSCGTPATRGLAGLVWHRRPDQAHLPSPGGRPPPGQVLAVGTAVYRLRCGTRPPAPRVGPDLHRRDTGGWQPVESRQQVRHRRPGPANRPAFRFPPTMFATRRGNRTWPRPAIDHLLRPTPPPSQSRPRHPPGGPRCPGKYPPGLPPATKPLKANRDGVVPAPVPDFDDRRCCTPRPPSRTTRGGRRNSATATGVSSSTSTRMSPRCSSGSEAWLGERDDLTVVGDANQTILLVHRRPRPATCWTSPAVPRRDGGPPGTRLPLHPAGGVAGQPGDRRRARADGRQQAALGRPAPARSRNRSSANIPTRVAEATAVARAARTHRIRNARSRNRGSLPDQRPVRGVRGGAHRAGIPFQVRGGRFLLPPGDPPVTRRPAARRGKETPTDHCRNSSAPSSNHSASPPNRPPACGPGNAGKR